MYARNFSTRGSRWLSGHITKLTGPVSVEVQLEDGSKARRHFDQIRKKHVSSSPVDSKHEPVDSEDPSVFVSYPPENIPVNSETDNLPTDETTDTTLETPPTGEPTDNTSDNPPTVSVDRPRRYPARDRKPPKKLTY